MLFFVALPLLYPIVYTLIYNPEVVRQLPIAVVDNCLNADSRQLVQKASASPSIEIYAYCADMPEARRLMAEKKCSVCFRYHRITPAISAMARLHMSPSTPT